MTASRFFVFMSYLCVMGQLSFIYITVFAVEAYGREVIGYNDLLKKEGELSSMIKMLAEREGVLDDIVYVGDDNRVESFNDVIRNMDKGKFIVFDMVDGNVNSQVMNQFFSGIAANSHIVIARKSDDGSPVLHQLSVVGNGAESIKTKRQLTRDDREKLVNDVVEILREWRAQKKLRRQDSRYYVKKPRENTIYLNLRYISLPCMVGKSYEGNAVTGYSRWRKGKIDACDKSASVSLFFTIDFIRSIADSNLGTEDAKYVRITLDPESNGGAGWHIFDKPSHRHSWFLSWSDRETWFGPVVDSYSISILPRDDRPRLYHAIPRNLPAHSNVSERTKIKIGFYGGISGLGSNEGIHEINDMDGIERDEYSFNSLNMYDEYIEPGPNTEQSVHEPEGIDIPVVRESFNAFKDWLSLTGDACQEMNDACDVFESYYGDVQGERDAGHQQLYADLQKLNQYINPQTHDDSLSARESDGDEKADDGKIRRLYTTHFSRNRSLNNVGMSSVLSYISERSINYSNYEYMITRRQSVSGSDDILLTWDRGFNYTSHLWRHHDKCMIWCQDWFFNDTRFSPAAYANFNPGFSVTYQVPSETVEQSTFDLVAAVKIVALGGRIQYKFFYQEYGPWSQKGTEYKFIQPITINWDADVFQEQLPVSLESNKQDGMERLCLSSAANGDNEKVSLKGCRKHRDQNWVMDSTNRIRSIFFQDRCLEYAKTGTLLICPCAQKGTQKWFWDINRLTNNKKECLDISDSGDLYVRQCSKRTAGWRSINRIDNGDVIHVAPIGIQQRDVIGDRHQ
ncbi:RICIN domain-containing protein [Kistimonas asteriae]|uniref:RICIN domain-containing protein n=1 Tax=Kistimonas asteriae TaxID=517724 RepID=UPI001BA916E6|nr:RICIN domain-containing protein [Kistimonas asteriae]